jgi:hypothetical protein
VNPLLNKLRATEPGPAEFLAANPAVAAAIGHTKAKIVVKVRIEVDALASNLKIILRDWCEERKIVSIGWASPTDPVAPEFGIDHLCDRLAQKLAQVRFEQFLETFCERLIELDQAERRSQ